MSRLTSPIFRFCLLFLPNCCLHLEKNIYSSLDHALQRLLLAFGNESYGPLIPLWSVHSLFQPTNPSWILIQVHFLHFGNEIRKKDTVLCYLFTWEIYFFSLSVILSKFTYAPPPLTLFRQILHVSRSQPRPIPPLIYDFKTPTTTSEEPEVP